MKKPLRSRKFWVAVLGAMFTAAAPFLGVPPAAVKLVAMLLGGYVASEAVVDASRAVRNGMTGGGSEDGAVR